MKIYTLQVYFDSFINQKKQWDFLLGMADYIELILNDKDCKKYISDIKKSKKAFLIENKELEKLFSKKARIANDDYRDLVKASKISNQPDISLNGVSAEVKTYPKISEVEKKIKDGQGTTLWDAWDKICLAYLAVFKKDNVIIENQKQDEYDKWILKNNPELILQMKQLSTYDIKKTHRHLPALPDVIVRENYKLFVASIHKYLVEKLKEEEQAFSQVDIGYKQHKIPAKKGDKSHEEAVFTMLFHPKNRRIFINGIQVKKFTWESENCKVFEDAFNNPNTVREIKSKRRAQDFVNSFGFIRKAKSLFFPISAGRRLMLNNPIKRKDLKELGLEDIEKMKDIPKGKRTCRYAGVLAVYNPKTKEFWTHESALEGIISDEPLEASGFGYDPIFISIAFNKYYSQLTNEERDSISHRGLGIQELLKYLNKAI